MGLTGALARCRDPLSHPPSARAMAHFKPGMVQQFDQEWRSRCGIVFRDSRVQRYMLAERLGARSMSATAHPRMTADAFIAWAVAQPEGKRYELVAGEVVSMAPERVGHGRTKLRCARRLAESVEAAALPCEVFVDGLPVRIDTETIYEPDVLVRCGERLDDNVTVVDDPCIVIEIVSPSPRKRDAGSKSEGYFRLPSVRHYLIVKTENQAIIHHRRDEAGEITTHIVRDGVLVLDPPGLMVRGLFDR